MEHEYFVNSHYKKKYFTDFVSKTHSRVPLNAMFLKIIEKKLPKNFFGKFRKRIKMSKVILYIKTGHKKTTN